MFQTMNIFLIIGNVINVIYNIPQVVKTYRTKSTVDFSEWFLFLRIFGNIIWVAYAIEVESILMLINNTVTVLSSIFIGYYKVIELYNKRKKESGYDEKVNSDLSKNSRYLLLDEIELNNSHDEL